MIVPADIQQRFVESLPFLTNLRDRVEGTLIPFCRDRGLLFEGRIKTVESVAEKVESGRFGTWAELDDLYACTIAVPLASDEQAVTEFLQDKFAIVRVRAKGAIPKPPDVFRFDSTRVIAKLRELPGLSANGAGEDHSLLFEIQVKSLFEHAWAKTTHALTYKSQIVDWKRHRLVAHLKAVAEQVDFLLVGFEEAAQLVPHGSYPDLDDKAKLKMLFDSLVEAGLIPDESIPKDWSRFIDNVYTALQVLLRSEPTGRSGRQLTGLDEAARLISGFFGTTDFAKIPRSLSLFQIVLGVLCSSGRYTGRSDRYHPVINDAFRRMFPGISAPGSVFESNRTG